MTHSQEDATDLTANRDSANHQRGINPAQMDFAHVIGRLLADSWRRKRDTPRRLVASDPPDDLVADFVATSP